VLAWVALVLAGCEAVRREISMTPVILAFLIGAVTGLRAMMAPAAVAWAAHQGALEDAVATGVALWIARTWSGLR
jgi:uncharacterized membrane protein